MSFETPKFLEDSEADWMELPGKLASDVTGSLLTLLPKMIEAPSHGQVDPDNQERVISVKVNNLLVEYRYPLNSLVVDKGTVAVYFPSGEGKIDAFSWNKLDIENPRIMYFGGNNEYINRQDPDISCAFLKALANKV